MHPTASSFVTFGIGVIALGVAAASIALYAAAVGRLGGSGGRAAGLAGLAVVAWLGITAAVGSSHALLDAGARPPRFAVVLAVVLATGVLIAASRVGRVLAQGLPLWVLVLFQGFRLPLELVMHQAAAEGTMPVALSFGGYNFDVVTGTLALVLGLALWAKKAPLWVVRAWNAFGMVALVGIAAIAVLTSPLVQAFGPDQVNWWVAYVPFIWLPTVLVVVAIAGHGVVARRLRAEGTAPVAPVSAESAGRP